MRAEVVARVVGRREHLDAEAGVERPRPEGVLAEAREDLVIDRIGRLQRRADGDAEQVDELRFEPVAHCGAAVDVPVPAELPPDASRPFLRQRVVADSELVERDAGGVEQPRDVVVRGDEHADRVVERLVEGEPPRIDVPVRADQGEVPDAS